MALFRPLITSINNLNSISFKASYDGTTVTTENVGRYHDSVSFITIPTTQDSTISCDFSNYLEGDLVVDFNSNRDFRIISNNNGIVKLYLNIATIPTFDMYMTVYGNGKNAPQPVIYDNGWDSDFNDDNPYIYIKNNVSFGNKVLTKGVQKLNIINSTYNHTHTTLGTGDLTLNNELKSNSYFFVDSAVTSITLRTSDETTSAGNRTYSSYDNPPEGMIVNLDLLQDRTKDLPIKQIKKLNGTDKTTAIKTYDKTVCKENKRLKLYLFENNWISIN